MTATPVRMTAVQVALLAILYLIVLASSTTLNSSNAATAFATTHTSRGGDQEFNDPSAMLLSSSNDDDDDETEEVDATNSTEGNDASTKKSKLRKQFLNRIAMVSSLLLRQEDARLVKETEEFLTDGITEQSDLTRPGRYIHIVTTAALPWFTGTAVNPLLRAAYLHDRMQQINANNASEQQVKSWVTLVIPWLELPEDQRELYNDRVFETPQMQEEFVREWLRTQAHMPDAADNLNIVFYNARYHAGLGSVFAMGDIISTLPQDELDVCILEEPEHVNWFRAPGTGWTKKYKFVLGIIHTNYFEYATKHYSGLWTAPAIRIMSAAMIRAYCHKVIKLSDVLQPFAPEKEVTENVHGVRQEFIQTRNSPEFSTGGVGNNTQAYFIGKLLWTKGLDNLLALQDYYKQTTGEYFEIDIWGSGPDKEEISRAYLGRRKEKKKIKKRLKPRHVVTKALEWANRRRRSKKSMKSPSKFKEALEQLAKDLAKAKESVEKLPRRARESMEQLADDLANIKFETTPIPKTLHEFRKNPIPATFPGRIDHAQLKDSYKIFVNPSVSEVLCTTTFEALAMGKYAIIPVHPSNTFFLQFPNCLGYRDPYEFVTNLQWALTHDPEPLSEELAREFSWEAAADRFVAASAITHREARLRESLGKSKVDERIAWFHNEMGKGAKGDIIRKVLGGGPVSNQVKYESEKRRSLEEEDDDQGLSSKFHNSAFVQAIRQATANSITAFSG